MADGRSVDDWIDGYCELLDFAESPQLFKKWVAISTIASALRRKCYLRWMPHEYTYPNMYIVLIGPPAIGKGVALGYSANMLKSLGIKMSAECATPQVLIRDLIDSTEVNTRNGTMVRESNITISSAEFSVFLGRDNFQLVDFLTRWYDCPGDWEYKTIGRGGEIVYGMYVNLIGLTVPAVFKKSMTDEALMGGLLSRTILVYSDKKSRIVPIPAISDETNILEGKLSADLQRIAELSGEFRITKDIIDLWTDWYVENESHSLKENPYLVQYAGRRATHLLKLLMVVSASRRDSMIITADDFARARELLEEAEALMPNAYRGYGQNELTEHIEVVMSDIRVTGYMYVSQLVKRHIRNVSLEDMQQILKTLEAMGFCKVVKGDKGNLLVKYTPSEMSELE